MIKNTCSATDTNRLTLKLTRYLLCSKKFYCYQTMKVLQGCVQQMFTSANVGQYQHYGIAVLQDTYWWLIGYVAKAYSKRRANAVLNLIQELNLT